MRFRFLHALYARLFHLYFLPNFLPARVLVFLLLLACLPAISHADMIDSSLQMPITLESTQSTNSQSPHLQSLQEFLRTAYEKTYADYNITISDIAIQLPTQASYPISSLSCLSPNSCSISPNALSRSSGTLLVKLHHNHNIISVPIPYNITAQISAVRANALISTNTNLTAQNTTTERVPLQQIKAAKLLPPRAVGSVSARSLISPNALISNDKVKELILVRKGDMVAATIKDETLFLQMQLQALQNGVKGEIIKVRNPSTQKILRAKVINENSVEIL